MMPKPRKDANLIIQHIIDCIYPANAVDSFVSFDGSSLAVGDLPLDLDEFSSVHVLAGGKAACAMADAIETILGDRITGGLVSTKYGHSCELRTLPILEAAHPIPDENSIKCAEETMKIASGLGKDDLLLVLISGGASSIWCSPAENITLDDKQSVTSQLLSCGATIRELNTVRKHLSGIKGGRLAEAAYPARVVSLILSDVIGDDLTSIASGPTVGDPSTFGDAMYILAKYHIRRSTPAGALSYLEAGMHGHVKETPTTVSDSDFQVIIGSNKLAKDAAESLGHSLGYNTHVIEDPVMGEARDAAARLCNLAKNIKAGNGPVNPPALLIAGGETTVTVKGHGKGGRNQEMALAAAIELEHIDGIFFLSFATDGTDGPTDAAGAFADSTTAQHAHQRNLHIEAFLDNNDSYNFFRRLDDLIVTGPTGSNVMDIQLVIIE
jgi:hydroxypyruvate reductase